jgi:hypothetical protein
MVLWSGVNTNSLTATNTVSWEEAFGLAALAMTTKASAVTDIRESVRTEFFIAIPLTLTDITVFLPQHQNGRLNKACPYNR